MKKFVFALFLGFFSFPAARADDCTYVCQDILNASQKIACLQAISGKEMQRSACAVCADILNASSKVQCMGTIADKRYSEGELKTCGEILNAGSKIECLRVAGRRLGGYPGNCDLRKFLRRLDGAIGSFESGYHRGGMNALYGLRDELQECAR